MRDVACKNRGEQTPTFVEAWVVFLHAEQNALVGLGVEVDDEDAPAGG